MKPLPILTAGTLLALALVGVVRLRPSQEVVKLPDPLEAPTPVASVPAPDPTAAVRVLEASFGRDALVSRWVTGSPSAPEEIELRTRRQGLETPGAWFARAAAERDRALALHPLLEGVAAPTPDDPLPPEDQALLLRVDWQAKSGIEHALLLHDDYLFGSQDWSAAADATVRQAWLVFPPDTPRQRRIR